MERQYPTIFKKAYQLDVVQKIVLNAEAGFNKLRAVLQPIVLKRTKNKMINGKPILVLPDKFETQQEDQFSPEESDFYQALWKSSVIQFNKYLKAGTVMQNYSNILVLLLRLRQACNHPVLVLNATSPMQMTQVTVVPRTLPAEIQERIKNSDVTECSICTPSICKI
jgi:SNF2 family DNA or RNA helicase